MFLAHLRIGTRVRSRYDPTIVGRIQGFGTLFPTPGPEHNQDYPSPVVVCLVWVDGSPGSNSLINPTVRVVDVTKMEIVE